MPKKVILTDSKSTVKKATAFLRIILGIEGVVLILRTPQIIAALTRDAGAGGAALGEFWANLASRMDTGMPILGMCALMTAWGLLSGKKWADRAGFMMSVIHLILFPFFTPVGLLGLAVWKRTKAVDGLNIRWQDPVPTAVLPGAFRLLASVAVCTMTATLYLLIGHSQAHEEELLPAWSLPLLLAAAFGILSVVHDLGHIFAGRISGFTFDSIHVGFLELDRTETGGWQRRKRDDSVWKYLRVGARATRLDRLDSRLVVLQLGGPLSEFVIGLVGFAAMVAAANLYAKELLGIFSLMASCRFVMEMALLRTSSEDYTDGARLVQLWNRDPEGERWCALHSIAQSRSEPVAPKDWPEAWVVRLSADPESPVYAAGCFYAYAHYLDRHDLERAEEFVNRLRSIKGWNNQERVAIEVAFFEAFTNQRTAAMVNYGGVFEQSPASMRMEAMALVSDGYTGEATEKIVQSRNSLGAGGWAIFENRLLGEIERRIIESRAGVNASAKPASALADLPVESFADLIRRTAM